MSEEKASRNNKGKPQLSYIFKAILAGVARVSMGGAAEYGRHNHYKGQPYSDSLDSYDRHRAAWELGEEIDPKSGQHHLDHMIWNAIDLRYNSIAHPENDDRPRFQMPQMTRLMEFLKAPYVEPHNAEKRTDLPGDSI